MTRLNDLKRDLRSLADKDKARLLSGFFKTGKGQYGEGDIFLGITVPKQRLVAQKYNDLSLADAVALLHSKEHEFRLTALIILVNQFKRGDGALKKKIFRIYLANTKWVNNWDLVDISSHVIVGGYLKSGRPSKDKNRALLVKLAHSDSLWERRIAVISTFAFIKDGEYKDAFHIAEILLKDKHDLIHKAVGWMLREVGKKCGHEIERKFLTKYSSVMPRTMLRYSLEHFTKMESSVYL